MLLNKVIVLFAAASIAAAAQIPRIPPGPGGCKEGYRLKEKKCGKKKSDICCPVKTKPHLILHKKDKGCIPPEPPGCPATHFVCPPEFDSCCPIGGFCGFAQDVPVCFT
ncbi:MAG: hypothetical protein J3Q66DRAFT_326651 [Benniella sp.]|nr:MAG: hypothetical protein J3Q66DRAFT_326651 [Benniella sp.]